MHMLRIFLPTQIVCKGSTCIFLLNYFANDIKLVKGLRRKILDKPIKRKLIHK